MRQRHNVITGYRQGNRLGLGEKGKVNKLLYLWDWMDKHKNSTFPPTILLLSGILCTVSSSLCICMPCAFTI
ncbi:hypothetical protein XELAEV_18045575mg [Xenopus laevis]|uniref:Uncharacterized protein n=1 Tax=Xenopus laevis TaxID=8355 RepID=A0A974C164_XENLA|nr:hypothetical protein XELAEV_18045575mg [Xenopus laevis]